MSELHLEALEVLPIPLFLLGPKNELLFANSAFAQLLSGEREAGEEHKAESFTVSITDFCPHIEKLRGREDSIALEFLTQRGASILTTVERVTMSDGVALFLVGGALGEPVRETFHSQRLETLGMLAGGIAHDFNNILAGILGHVTYLKTILPAQGPHIESLTAVEDGARKASTMTKQILDFSKLETEERPVPVNMEELAEGTFRLLKGAIPPSLRLQFDCRDSGVAVLGVEGKIAQVIANLVINARDAVAVDGEIQLVVSSEEAGEHLLELFGVEELTAARYACLRVIDDGAGMSDETKARVFEPYFTTKGGRGTGLGLATVNQIVHSFGGAIEITSALGEGTTVAVYFPLLGESSHPAFSSNRASSSQPELMLGTESILVVDDEYSVRNVLAMSLDHLGYTVRTAASGMEALEVFEEDPAAVDLVILDMLMPKLSGEEVFERLKEIRNDVRVLVISGFSSEDAVNQILQSGGLGFVQKPFTIEELSQKVRNCLDSAT